MAEPQITQTNLVLTARKGSGEKVYWDAQWRFRTDDSAPWRMKKQRLGLAWLEADDNGGWRKRRGRCRDGWLDERAANLAAEEAMANHFETIRDAEERARVEHEQELTVRALAQEWLLWLQQVRGAKPATVRDYATLLREPGTTYKRGKGASRGRIMEAFGDMPSAAVTTRDVSRFLRSLDLEGLKPRNVNKYRQVLQAMFTYACRSDTFELPSNPVERTDKRRELQPAALDYYEVEEVEALARACERGQHRPTVAVSEAEAVARTAEDYQDAESFRILFYTGIRIGELLTLRWADVDLGDARCWCVGISLPTLRPSRRDDGTDTCRCQIQHWRHLPGSARGTSSSARTTTWSATAGGAGSTRPRSGAVTTAAARSPASAASSSTACDTRRAASSRGPPTRSSCATTSATRSSAPPTATSAPSTDRRTSTDLTVRLESCRRSAQIITLTPPRTADSAGKLGRQERFACRSFRMAATPTGPDPPVSSTRWPDALIILCRRIRLSFVSLRRRAVSSFRRAVWSTFLAQRGRLRGPVSEAGSRAVQEQRGERG